MTSIHDNEIRALNQDDLQNVVGGGGLLPIPPYQGGPIASPIIPPVNHKTPIPPIVTLPMPVITV
jgi:hypothetical protein